MPEGIFRGTSIVPRHVLEFAELSNEPVLERLDDMMVLEFSATKKHAATVMASYGGQKQSPALWAGIIYSALNYLVESCNLCCSSTVTI